MTRMSVSAKAAVKEVQELSFLAGKSFASIFRRPFYVKDICASRTIALQDARNPVFAAPAAGSLPVSGSLPIVP